MKSRSKVGVGRIYEKRIEEFLKAEGYRIIFRNFRYSRLEIDLIALEGKNLVFFEVKYRKRHPDFNPASAVTKIKQNRIKKCASFFLTQKPAYRSYYCRFDVVFIIDKGGTLNIEHYKHAFR